MNLNMQGTYYSIILLDILVKFYELKIYIDQYFLNIVQEISNI